MAGCIGTYYYDGTSFATSTSVYTNASLSTVAADGWYSQNGISRRMVSGVLQQAQACVTCQSPCTVTPSANNAGGGQYKATIDLGTAIGAVVLTFSPQNVPDKLTWVYDGTTASEYSSQTYGYLQGVIGQASAAASTLCDSNLGLGSGMDNANGSNGGSYPGSAVYNWDAGSNTFVASGATTTLGPYANKAAGGVDFTASGPGTVVMVIPKPNATPSSVLLTVEAPCAGTAWSMTSSCPAPLTATTQCTVAKGTQNFACTETTRTNTLYNVPVNGTAGNIGLYDWVFTDANGVTQAPFGFYSSGAQGTGAPWFEVSTDGVVVQTGTCP